MVFFEVFEGSSQLWKVEEIDLIQQKHANTINVDC